MVNSVRESISIRATISRTSNSRMAKARPRSPMARSRVRHDGARVGREAHLAVGDGLDGAVGAAVDGGGEIEGDHGCGAQ
ncbi:MAG: hypothetical protein ACP5HM_06945 [Anaerolineae bacterium]